MEQPRGINILITGTPGTGKTSLSSLLAAELEGFQHIEVGQVVKENRFYSEFDEQLNTHIIEEEDEDRLLDYLEPILVKGGNHIVDYHSSELFPERWFHLVVVLHTSTNVLFERLTSRKYSEAKRGENMDAEIQCVCEEEAREAYKEGILLVRENDTLEQMAATVDEIRERVEALKAERGLI